MERGGSRAASAYADGPWIERSITASHAEAGTAEAGARMNRARKERRSSRGVEAEALPATSVPWQVSRRGKRGQSLLLETVDRPRPGSTRGLSPLSLNEAVMPIEVECLRRIW
jgi:hypothetical protein